MIIGQKKLIYYASIVDHVETMEAMPLQVFDPAKTGVALNKFSTYEYNNMLAFLIGSITVNGDCILQLDDIRDHEEFYVITYENLLHDAVNLSKYKDLLKRHTNDNFEISFVEEDPSRIELFLPKIAQYEALDAFFRNLHETVEEFCDFSKIEVLDDDIKLMKAAISGIEEVKNKLTGDDLSINKSTTHAVVEILDTYIMLAKNLIEEEENYRGELNE